MKKMTCLAHASQNTRRAPNKQSLISNFFIGCYHCRCVRACVCTSMDSPPYGAAFKIHKKLISFESVGLVSVCVLGMEISTRNKKNSYRLFFRITMRCLVLFSCDSEDLEFVFCFFFSSLFTVVAATVPHSCHHSLCRIEKVLLRIEFKFLGNWVTGSGGVQPSHLKYA